MSGRWAQVLAAAWLDVLAADPCDRFHPVWWTGKLIALLEKAMYSVNGGYAGGAALAASTLGVTALALRTLSGKKGSVRPAHWIAGILVVDSAISFRQLTSRSREVRVLLEEGDLERAREVAGGMVGRDTVGLPSGEIVRAVVETLAENASDGVIAPLVYALLGGAGAAYLYRTVNTLDSMVGYRNERYEDFGRVSARLDDLANLLPSRITAALLLAADALAGGDVIHDVNIVIRDAPGHDSPNAGWPEAAMAASLGVRLGGANLYGGVENRGAYLGDPLRPLAPSRIDEAVGMITMAYAIFLGLVALGGPFAGRMGRKRRKR